MSTAIVPLFSRGIDATKNVVYINENTVAHVSGVQVCLHQLETKQQSFFHTSPKTESISAIALSANNRYLAVAERGDVASISIWDVQAFSRKKVLTAEGTSAREFAQLAFAPDNQHIVALTCEPDWALCVFKLGAKQSKPLDIVKDVCGPSNPIKYISFSPQDSGLWAVSGGDLVKFYRYTEKQIREVSAVKTDTDIVFTCHCWVDDNAVVVGTEHHGCLLADATGDVKMTLPPAQPSTPDARITCCATLGQGFVVGLDNAVAVVYQPAEGRELFKPGHTLTVPSDLRDRAVMSSVTASLGGDAAPLHFTSIAVSSSHEALCLVTSACSLLHTNLVSAELRARVDGESNNSITLQEVGLGGHNGECVDTDLCLRRPLIATVGRDQMLNIYDYEERVLEFSKQFAEQVHAVALHPSGFYIALAINDRVRLGALLNDDIRDHKEFNLKGVRVLEFSQGGMYLAAVSNQLVYIFNVYTFELVVTLRGHSSKVRAVSWGRGDATLTTAGMDGAVYTWSLPDGRRVQDCVVKGCPYTSVLMSKDGETILAAASDMTVKKIMDDSVVGEIAQGSIPRQLAVTPNESHLIVGTATGALRLYALPFDETKGADLLFETGAHAGLIHKLRVTPDGTRIVSVGMDGVLLVHQLQDPAALGGEAPFQAQEILVARTEMADKTALVRELQTKIDELTVQGEYQLRLREMGHQEELKAESAKWSEEVEREKAKLEQTEHDKAELEINLQRRMKTVEEEHVQELQQLELQYQQKLVLEVERYAALQAERDSGTKKADEHAAQLIASHERIIQDLTSSYEEKVQELSLLLENALQKNDDLQREFDETRDQMEDDADTELDEMRRTYETQLDGEKDMTLRLKGENGVLRRRFTVLKNRIQEQDEQLEKKGQVQQDLLQKIEGHKKDKEGLRKEITERDETIADKERRIYDLKKKNQELEKFKFVLDYKIKELKKQIEPRELEIGSMHEQIREMDAELERFHKQNSRLELQITDLKLKIDALQRDGATTRRKLADSDSRRQGMEADIGDLVQLIQEPKKLKEAARTLHKKHVTGIAKAAAVDEDLRDEHERQRVYLERTVRGLKTQLEKETRVRSADHRHILQENVELIKEINMLRKELKSVRAQAMQTAPGKVAQAGPAEKQLRRDLEAQRSEMVRLRQRVAELEDTQAMRPTSREELPQLDDMNMM
ncbi:WD domain, G-beta repeat [Carpediemonas membranifera]|uniref:WD domain, G-beta repeat n=1 Tax=Carpediemonas membranifera TaxID=201153 RepID=A0A8J6BBM0_9EUKA|nr:WD domain, G-beta repeat [Carpediemonas membranifera]|eukprot:KAG9393987.1 WD domain, G-beta repeat [Carpediemonas membranifera]